MKSSLDNCKYSMLSFLLHTNCLIKSQKRFLCVFVIFVYNWVVNCKSCYVLHKFLWREQYLLLVTCDLCTCCFSFKMSMSRTKVVNNVNHHNKLDKCYLIKKLSLSTYINFSSDFNLSFSITFSITFLKCIQLLVKLSNTLWYFQ